jgi:hypothetical protein
MPYLRPCRSRPSSRKRSRSSGPFDWDRPTTLGQRVAQGDGAARVVDVAVGQQDLLDLDAGLGDRLADAVDVAAGVDHGAALGGVVPQDRAVLLERGHRDDRRL